MKSIFTSMLIAISISGFAQEAGKAGEFLKNEASKTELNTQKSDKGFRNNKSSNNRNSNNQSGALDNSGFRNPNNSGNNNSSSSGQTSGYRWNQNFGYSEVFLRIPEYGYFTVEIGDQTISNASGKFRFFDLDSGRMPISIYQDGFLIYRTQLSVSNNNRIVLDFFTHNGLYLLDSYPIKGQTYGFNQWDDVWNNPYNNGWGNSNPSNVMNNQSFSQFMTTMKREASFDNNKKDFILQQLRTTQFTSKQIAEMLTEFSFDTNRLELAKQLFNSCVDRNNFFIVFDAFTYQRYKDDLMKFISKS
ncbi:DUF4476 domain-containing protein [Chryseobacterium sp. T1]